MQIIDHSPRVTELRTSMNSAVPFSGRVYGPSFLGVFEVEMMIPWELL